MAASAHEDRSDQLGQILHADGALVSETDPDVDGAVSETHRRTHDTAVPRARPASLTSVHRVGSMLPADEADGHNVAGRGITTGRAARIAWHRARAFSMVGRVPGLGVVIAPWLWPIHLAGVAAQGDQIRHRKTASMALSDGGPHRAHRPAMVLAATTLLVQFILLVTISSVVAVLLLPLIGPTWAGPVAVLVVASPLILEWGIGGVVRLIRNRESLTLNRRRRELAKQGPAYVMTSFVRSPRHDTKGEGHILLAVMRTEWLTQRAVVIFYPAGALTRYYTNEGASLDVGAKHLLQFDSRVAAE
jgi:hypothetical protein